MFLGFMRLGLSAALLASLALSAPAARAQGTRTPSLADVARKEAERRKAVAEGGKVYTNKDLPSVPPSSGAASPDTTSPDATTPDATTPDTASADAKDASTGADTRDASAAGDAKGGNGQKKDSREPAKDQKYWSERLQKLQTTLSRDQAFAEALQVQINALTTDFVNRDDPAQRAVVSDNRQRALDELARVKTAIEDDKKAIADLEEEARVEGVPAGWLR